MREHERAKRNTVIISKWRGKREKERERESAR